MENENGMVESIKKFHMLTFVGLGLLLLFIIFCFITTVAVRWWLMIPIAVAGVIVLYTRMKQASGLEKKVCLFAVWGMVTVFVLRDIVMSYRVASLLDGMQDLADQFRNAFN